MEYVINFQVVYEGEDRPTDDGDLIPFRFNQESSHFIPGKGDFVNIVRGSDDKEIFGKVVSLLFMYSSTTTGESSSCGVNIVIQEIQDYGEIWNSLIKE